jgi:hypothetical protein
MKKVLQQKKDCWYMWHTQVVGLFVHSKRALLARRLTSGHSNDKKANNQRM